MIPEEDSLKRYQHKLLRMKETIFAFGGETTDSDSQDVIKRFNRSSNSWEDSGQRLQSNDTEELIALQFPISSLDCVPKDCKCGVSKESRIFGGEEVQVRLNTY